MCSPLKRFLLIVPLKATIDFQRFWFWLHRVQFDSALSCTLRNLIPWCDVHRTVFEKFGSLDSAMGCTLRSLTPRRDAHHGAWQLGIMHTEESDSAGWCTTQSLTPRYDAHQGALYQYEYLSKIETKFENTSPCLSGAQLGSNHEKNGGQKSRVTLPLSHHREKVDLRVQYYWTIISPFVLFNIKSTV